MKTIALLTKILLFTFFTMALAGCNLTPKPVVQTPKEIKSAELKRLNQQFRTLYFSTFEDEQILAQQHGKGDIFNTFARVKSYFRDGVRFDAKKVNGRFIITKLYFPHFNQSGDVQKAPVEQKSANYNLEELNYFSLTTRVNYDIPLLKLEALIQAYTDILPQAEQLYADLMLDVDSLFAFGVEIVELKKNYKNARFSDSVIDGYKKIDPSWYSSRIFNSVNSYQPDFEVKPVASEVISLLATTLKNEIHDLKALNNNTASHHEQLIQNRFESLKESNAIARLYWAQAQMDEHGISRGQQVCDPSNRIGFVEDIASSRFKVTWIAQVINEPENFWFGNMGVHNISLVGPDGAIRYDYRDLSEVRWVRSNQVGQCYFEH